MNSLFTFHFPLLLHLSLCIVNGGIISRQRSERRKLCSTCQHRHLRMLLRHMMRVVYYVIVIVCQIVNCKWDSEPCSPEHLRSARNCTWYMVNGTSHALWPPICALRSFAVAPSRKFSPFSRAFFPNRCFIASRASCIRLSFSSASSCSLR